MVIATLTGSVTSCGNASPAPDSPTETAGGSQAPATPAETTTTAVSGSAGGGSCTVTVSGDLELELSFDQSIYSMNSDYWTSEEDLRGVVETLGVDIAGGTYDELVANGKPIVTFLALSCQDPDNLVEGALATHTNATLRSDLPMGPGYYPIIDGMAGADGAAGSIIAGFGLADDSLFQTTADSGSLEITRWDRSEIDGSLNFDAEEIFAETPRKIHVAVEFSFRCGPWHSGC